MVPPFFDIFVLIFPVFYRGSGQSVVLDGISI